MFEGYRRLQDAAFYLCNPDRKRIGEIVVKSPECTLRFNDLSELTFEVPEFVEREDGSIANSPSYLDIAAKRLVYVDEVGWFQIQNVQKVDDGAIERKTIAAESHQTMFKNIGFAKEERVYKFYDANDPRDDKYNASDIGALPSVVGQLHRQLGIEVDLHDVGYAPEEDFGQWTIVYIPNSLYYVDAAETNICRSFKDSETTYGYDFMVNDVEEAFEVVFEFDILHHAIKIKTVSEITQKTGVWLSYDNLINTTIVEENADDIVTVLNCNGTDIDITSVNPTGKNYIVDFSYYMDESEYKWMSKELIDKLKAWKQEVQAQETRYSNLVKMLYDDYIKKASYSERTQYLSLKTQDLEALRDKIAAGEDLSNSNFVAETVNAGEKSIYAESIYNAKGFKGTDVATFHEAPPVLTNGIYGFTDAGTSKTFDEAAGTETPLLYFIDNTGNTYTFCKITQGEKLNETGDGSVQYASGFERFAQTARLSEWLNIYAKECEKNKNDLSYIDKVIGVHSFAMSEISSALDLQAYMGKTPALLQELRAYWIEGEYTNENIAALENTTQSERIELARELKTSGERELARVSQPKLSFSIDVINFLSIKEFRPFADQLELGSVVTVEKKDGERYYPALTVIKFGFENDSTVELTFSNSLKLDDWGFTYADLIASSASTSRAVSANWTQLNSYTKDKAELKELTANPLDRALRYAEANQLNQEFVVDTTGILGRKWEDDSRESFSKEQVRMINNLLLFTDDGWNTCKTALGKITYKDESGNDVVGYGLAAQVLIGNLILGSNLRIADNNNFVIIDKNGIEILNGRNDVFKATTDGDVYIKGIIEADSGKFGKCNINPDGSIVSANGHFEVDAAGNITATDANLTGIITATAGKIGGCVINDNGTLGLNDGTFLIDAVNKKLRIGSASTTYVELTSEEGGILRFRDGANESNATTLWHHSFEMNGLGRSLSFGMENLFGGGTQTYLRFSPGFALSVSDGDSTHKVVLNAYSETEESGLSLFGDKLTLTANTSGALNGTWTTNSEPANSSDRTLKNSIEALGDAYSALFDGLRPVRYKYNDGTSGRYHTGFVAQELKEAMDEAGLTATDFAGYVEGSDGVRRIRYGELIALCVREIQLLKARIKGMEGIKGEQNATD